MTSVLLSMLLAVASAQAAAAAQAPAAGARRPAPATDPGPPADTPPVVTRHEARVGGRTIRYTVTTGLMPVQNTRTGEVEARIFFMAYTLDGPRDPKRPLMFSFNGGPGSASVWLHLGALGPRRVRMLDDGAMPPPPYELVDNEWSLLDTTDLVFIDPVGTGYSRPVKPELGEKFWSVQGDIQSVGEFIRMYLGRYERWTSPLFVIGESYGTTRAAGLAGHLVNQGIALNGVVLVSTILNFQTADFPIGNDLPYALYVPTYAATAWYHRKLDPADQGKDLRAWVAEAEAWALSDYTVALAKGDALAGAERRAVAERLARFTGLDVTFVERANLRITDGRFYKELLRDRGLTVGRLDSRFTGSDRDAAGESPEFDPSLAAIRPPYTALFNQYVRGELGWETDTVYHILGGGVRGWDWNADNRFVDTAEPLRQAFARNPYMRVFVASGYYDFATPYFAAQYTFRHMGLDPTAKGRFSYGFYEAGHMMYIDTASLAALKEDLVAFIARAVANTPRPLVR